MMRSLDELSNCRGGSSVLKASVRKEWSIFLPPVGDLSEKSFMAPVQEDKQMRHSIAGMNFKFAPSSIRYFSDGRNVNSPIHQGWHYGEADFKPNWDEIRAC